MKQALLDAFAFVRSQAIGDIRFIQGNAVFDVALNTKILEQLKLLETECFYSAKVENKTISSIPQLHQYSGKVAEIVFSIPVCTDPLFSKNWDTFFASPVVKKGIPKNFYIIQENVTSSSNSDQVKRVFLLGEFAAMLRCVSDFVNHENSVYYILCGDKIEIPFEISKIDVFSDCKVSVLVDRVLPVINGEKAKEKSIFRSSLIERVKTVPEQQRFAYIFRNAERIKETFEHNFELYLANFSFEKVRNELVEKRIESIGKVDSIVSDSINKLLTVPVALLVIGIQFKAGLLLNNVIIFIGMVTFCCIMIIQSYQQRAAIDSVKSDFERYVKMVKEELPALHSQIDRECSGFVDGLASKKYTTCFVTLAFVITLLFSITLFDYMCPQLNWILGDKIAVPIRDWLKGGKAL